MYAQYDIPEIPESIRKLRSCIACGLLQTTDYWSKSVECPNCKMTSKKFELFTSASFTGVIAVFSPSKSWCASWQRYNMNRPGLYALNNEGEVTHEICQYLEEEGRPLPEWVERYKLSQNRQDED